MKRFTETEKWKDAWFRRLKPAEKLLWFYIIDNCDNAGFFEMDVEMCEFLTGMKSEHIESALAGLSSRLIAGEGLFYVTNFLKHQKNATLNPENNAHKQIIALIEEHKPKFSEKDRKKLAPKQPLNRGTGKGKGIVYTDDFLQFWEAYPKKTGKDAAVRAFDKVKKRVDVAELVKAVEAQKHGEDWTNGGGKYIPHPATWLNQGRWADEVKVKKEAWEEYE